jgi:hypothetical protein
MTLLGASMNVHKRFLTPFSAHNHKPLQHSEARVRRLYSLNVATQDSDEDAVGINRIDSVRLHCRRVR